MKCQVLFSSFKVMQSRAKIVERLINKQVPDNTTTADLESIL
jgi:hypothetical protein